MTPSLPNITLGGNANSFQDRATPAFSNQSGEPFDHVMASALTTAASQNGEDDQSSQASTTSNLAGAEVDANNQLQPQAPADVPKPGTDHAKKILSHSVAPAGFTAFPGNTGVLGQLGKAGSSSVPALLAVDLAPASETLLPKVASHSTASAVSPDVLKTNPINTIPDQLGNPSPLPVPALLKANAASASGVSTLKVEGQPTAPAGFMSFSGTKIVPGQFKNVSPPSVPAFLAANAALVPGPSLPGQSLATMAATVETKAISMEPLPIPNPTVANAQPSTKSKSVDKTGLPSAPKPVEASLAVSLAESPLKTSSVPSSMLPIPPAGQKDSDAVGISDKTVVEDPAAVKFTSVSNSATKDIDPTPGASDGTPAAQQSVSMPSTAKTNEIASLPGKNLPGNAVPLARENNFPLRADPNVANVSSDLSTPNGSASVTASTGSLDATQAAAGSNSSALERTHELVTLHALRLTSTGTNSLQVVIKPDTGTQLSLELRQRGNGIEAEATLQQGDFTHLNQHWAQLQQHLEQRGIRLAPLADNNFVGTGNGAFQPKQNHTPSESETIGAFAGPVPAILPGVSNLQSPAARRGWETWA
jgi:hypothetical protein